MEWEEREDGRDIFTSELTPTNRIRRQQRTNTGVNVRG